MDGVDLPNTKDTPVTACIKHRFMDGLSLLLKNGASSRMANGTGLSPAFVACAGSSTAAAECVANVVPY